jgi:flavodoxin I
MASILYYSMTGNTRKIATAIAEELGVDAKSIKTLAGVPEDGLLFIGSGSYGDKPGEDMVKFIEKNDFKDRRIALFGTSAKGAGLEVRAMEEALKQKGANVIGSYYCKGKSFVVVNIGHPGKDDLAGAKKFAWEMVRLG